VGKTNTGPNTNTNKKPKTKGWMGLLPLLEKGIGLERRVKWRWLGAA